MAGTARMVSCLAVLRCRSRKPVQTLRRKDRRRQRWRWLGHHGRQKLDHKRSKRQRLHPAVHGRPAGQARLDTKRLRRLFCRWTCRACEPVLPTKSWAFAVRSRARFSSMKCASVGIFCWAMWASASKWRCRRSTVGASASRRRRWALPVRRWDAGRYALERKTFGQPIANHQAIQWGSSPIWRRNWMRRRLLTLRAAQLKEQRPAAQQKESAMAVGCLRRNAPTALPKSAMQIFGGSSYVRRLPAEQHYRDAKITEIYEGTSGIMRIVITPPRCSRDKVGRPGKSFVKESAMSSHLDPSLSNAAWSRPARSPSAWFWTRRCPACCACHQAGCDDKSPQTRSGGAAADEWEGGSTTQQRGSRWRLRRAERNAEDRAGIGATGLSAQSLK